MSCRTLVYMIHQYSLKQSVRFGLFCGFSIMFVENVGDKSRIDVTFVVKLEEWTCTIDIYRMLHQVYSEMMSTHGGEEKCI
jgi:hypothetical protein